MKGVVETYSANTNIWLETNNGIKINNFVEREITTVSISGSLFVEEDELQDWDSLSDEALLNFEQDLI